MSAHKYSEVPTADGDGANNLASPLRPEEAGCRRATIFTSSHISVSQPETQPSASPKMFNQYLPVGKYGQYVAAIVGETTGCEYVVWLRTETAVAGIAFTVVLICISGGWSGDAYPVFDPNSTLATFSLFVSAQVCGWPTGALPKIIDGSAGFTLTDTQKSLVVSLPNIGAVISPIPCGYIMDRIGRKTTLSVSIFFVITCWTILAFTQNVTLILLARLIMGMWNGTEYITVSIYIAEVVDPNVRGSLISITGMMFYLGALYISFISYASYQTMTLLCIVSPVILFIGFLFIPESPYFYLMHGKRKEAEKSIIWLRGECQPKDLDRMEDAVKEQLTKQGTFMEIITKASNRKGFFLVECFKFCSASSATLLLFPFSTQLLPYGWLSPQGSHIVLCSVWVISAMISSGLMFRFKRRSLMMVSTIGTIVLLLSTASWYYLRDKTTVETSSTAWLPLILLCVAVFFETIGIINIPNIMKGEVFPINIKTKACALSCMTACGCEAINYLLFYQIINHIGMYFHFVKSALTAAFSLFIVLFFMIETKGHSLEKIQEMLNAKKPPKGCHGIETEMNKIESSEKT